MNTMCGLTVSGYSSATEALEREGWRLSEMGQASGWGRVHSYVFANRNRNLCTVETACVPALEEADAWNITLTYDPRTLLLFTFGTFGENGLCKSQQQTAQQNLCCQIETLAAVALV